MVKAQELAVVPVTVVGLARSNATPKSNGPRNDPMKPTHECAANLAPFYPDGASATVPTVTEPESRVMGTPSR